MLFWLAVGTLAFYLVFLIDMVMGNRHLMCVSDETPWPIDPAASENADSERTDSIPLVSIIIPARNEERNLAAALRSMLAQDYPRLEFILINDRSTDRTGQIMRELAANDSRLHVTDIEALPAGWMGKNYALAFGAERAAGELLLFADADIIMDKTVIRRTVGYLRRQQTDHLAIAPSFLPAPPLLTGFLGTFAVFFSFYAMPWRVHRPHSRAFVGIGAFNLLRREVYEKIGTHRAIAMRPDDDMKLGKLVKRGGFRQEFMHGAGMLQVEWYACVREMIDGLMKNAFAGVDYSLLQVILSFTGICAGILWPCVALFTTHGAVFWFNAAIVSALALLFCLIAPLSGISRRYVVFFPLGTAFMLFIIARATFLTYKNDGISWRGTHYSLAELRANKV